MGVVLRKPCGNLSVVGNFHSWISYLEYDKYTRTFGTGDFDWRYKISTNFRITTRASHRHETIGTNISTLLFLFCDFAFCLGLIFCLFHPANFLYWRFWPSHLLDPLFRRVSSPWSPWEYMFVNGFFATISEGATIAGTFCLFAWVPVSAVSLRWLAQRNWFYNPWKCYAAMHVSGALTAFHHLSCLRDWASAHAISTLWKECACQQILILQRLGTMRRQVHSATQSFETSWNFKHVNAFWCEPVCWTSRFASSITGACTFSGSGLVCRAHSKFLQVALHETRLYKLKLSHTLPILRRQFHLNPWRLFFFRSALSRNCQSHQWNTWWNGVSLCPGRLWNVLLLVKQTSSCFHLLALEIRVLGQSSTWTLQGFNIIEGFHVLSFSWPGHEVLQLQQLGFHFASCLHKDGTWLQQRPRNCGSEIGIHSSGTSCNKTR